MKQIDPTDMISPTLEEVAAGYVSVVSSSTDPVDVLTPTEPVIESGNGSEITGTGEPSALVTVTDEAGNASASATRAVDETRA